MNDWNNKYLTNNAERLRRGMTKEEKHLWYDFLKQLDVTVQRQKVLKRYIVDFYIAKAKLIIELDGSQHYTTDTAERLDRERDDYFNRNGYTVLRYTNLEIQKNFRGVCEDIMLHLNTSSDSALPSHLPLKGKANTRK